MFSELLSCESFQTEKITCLATKKTPEEEKRRTEWRRGEERSCDSALNQGTNKSSPRDRMLKERVNYPSEVRVVFSVNVKKRIKTIHKTTQLNPPVIIHGFNTETREKQLT